MGRGKIEIKKIDNATSRQVTFSKRRNGILKKAFELSILCDVEIGVMIFSPTGKMFQYASSSMDDIWARYRGLPEDQRDKTSKKHENAEVLGKEIKKLKREIELLKQLDGQGIESLSVEELRQLEKRMEANMVKVRERKDELMIQEIEELRLKVERAEKNELFLHASIHENPLVLLKDEDRQSPAKPSPASIPLLKPVSPFSTQMPSTFSHTPTPLPKSSTFIPNHHISAQYSSSALQLMSDRFPCTSSQFTASIKLSPSHYSSQASTPKPSPLPSTSQLSALPRMQPLGSPHTTLDLLEKDGASDGSSRKVKLPQTTLHLGLHAGWEYDEPDLSYDLNINQEELQTM